MADSSAKQLEAVTQPAFRPMASTMTMWMGRPRTSQQMAEVVAAM